MEAVVLNLLALDGALLGLGDDMKCPRCGEHVDRLYQVGFAEKIESSVSGSRRGFSRKVCVDCVKWFQREVGNFVQRLEKAASFMA